MKLTVYDTDGIVALVTPSEKFDFEEASDILKEFERLTKEEIKKIALDFSSVTSLSGSVCNFVCIQADTLGRHGVDLFIINNAVIASAISHLNNVQTFLDIKDFFETYDFKKGNTDEKKVKNI